jgi:hypothetical protein
VATEQLVENLLECNRNQFVLSEHSVPYHTLTPICCSYPGLDYAIRVLLCPRGAISERKRQSMTRRVEACIESFGGAICALFINVPFQLLQNSMFSDSY